MNKFLFGLVLVPALAVTALAQGQTNAKAQAYYHFSKGRLLDDQGQAGQAIEEFKKALEIDPNNSLIYSEMAESYLRNNKLREAADTATKAISVDGDNIEAHILPLVEGTHAGAFDGADMNENVFAAVYGLNETKALLAVKPLHNSLIH